MSVTVSVVICTYTDARWELLGAALASVGRQTFPATQRIVVARITG